MKVQDMLGVLELTQNIKLLDKNAENKSLYEGIVAGCFNEYKKSDVKKLKIVDNTLVMEIDYKDVLHYNTSNEDLLNMYFDESELGMDIGDLEKNLENLIGGLDDLKFDFDLK